MMLISSTEIFNIVVYFVLYFVNAFMLNKIEGLQKFLYVVLGVLGFYLMLDLKDYNSIVPLLLLPFVVYSFWKS